MKCSTIIEELEKIAPSYLAEKWDNVGLLAGHKEKEIKKILLALDPSREVVEEAISQKADMLITHHPLIFSGIKTVTREHFIGRRLYDLIQNDICYYAMHTNFDVMGMADAVADQLELEKCKVLDITYQDEISEEGIGRVGELSRTMSLEEFAHLLKEKCKITGMRIFGDPQKLVDVVALVPGSGKDYISLAMKHGADVFITGDLGHHHGLDAMEQELALIDAGHYGLEKIFSSYMAEALKRKFPEMIIKKATEKSPFWVI